MHKGKRLGLLWMALAFVGIIYKIILQGIKEWDIMNKEIIQRGK